MNVTPLSVDHLVLEVDRLQAENRRLRARLREQSRYADRLRRAYAAALLMAQMHVSFQSTSRRAMRAAGLTQRQFENGLALLRLARVVNGRKFMVHDLATIEAALQKAYDKALDVPESFFARLSKHARTTRK